jgi:hypothetical protein
VRTNGRIEATQVDVSAKYPGRLATLTVNEGDEVTAAQVVGTSRHARCIDFSQSRSIRITVLGGSLHAALQQRPVNWSSAGDIERSHVFGSRFATQ